MPKIFANPLFKTIITLAAGAILPSIDLAIQHPSGGLESYLASHPTIGLLYLAGASYVHNLITSQTVAASSPTAPSLADSGKK